MNEMTVTSAQYYRDIDDTANVGVIAVIEGETLSVPLDTANTHYQAILDWVADGNTIQDAS